MMPVLVMALRLHLYLRATIAATRTFNEDRTACGGLLKYASINLIILHWQLQIFSP
jgi:hypothetical protein